MNVNTAIGAKVKRRRTDKKMTLKQLGEQTGLSVGFLSQFERGLSSIALDSLEKIAKVLETPLSELFEEHNPSLYTDPVVHGIDLRFDGISDHIFQSSLRSGAGEFQMNPKLYTLLPLADENTQPEMYSHEGEALTLYAGDSIHIDSKKDHNWMNRSTKIAKILSVNLYPAQS